ncbi:hypothetical protein ACOME3_005465 [Neoechinorhynchus agilis]
MSKSDESPKQMKKTKPTTQEIDKSQMETSVSSEQNRLTGLNAELDVYLNEVKLLEQQNQSLSQKIVDLKSIDISQAQTIHFTDQPKLSELRQTLDKNVANLQVSNLFREEFNRKAAEYRQLINVELKAGRELDEYKRQIVLKRIDLQNTCGWFQSEIKSAIERNSGLEDNVRRQQSEVDDLEIKFRKAAIERIRVEAELQSIKEEIIFFNERLFSLIEELNDYMKRISGRNSLLNDMGYYREQLELIKIKLRQDFEQVNRVAGKRFLEEHEKRIESLKEMRNAMERDQESVLAARQKHDTVINELNNAKKELEDAVKLGKQMEDQLQTLQNEHNDYQAFRSSTVASLDVQIAALKEQIAKVIIDKDEQRQGNDNIEFELRTYAQLLNSERSRLRRLSGFDAEKTARNEEKDESIMSVKGEEQTSVEEKDSSFIQTVTVTRTKTQDNFDEVILDCRCGVINVVSSDTSELIQCADCQGWSHCACYNIRNPGERKRRRFYCQPCYRQAKRTRI